MLVNRTEQYMIFPGEVGFVLGQTWVYWYRLYTLRSTGCHYLNETYLFHECTSHKSIAVTCIWPEIPQRSLIKITANSWPGDILGVTQLLLSLHKESEWHCHKPWVYPSLTTALLNALWTHRLLLMMMMNVLSHNYCTLAFRCVTVVTPIHRCVIVVTHLHAPSYS